MRLNLPILKGHLRTAFEILAVFAGMCIVVGAFIVTGVV